MKEPEKYSYQWYKQQRQKITDNIAPVGAIPKHSKGDYAKRRFNKETISLYKKNFNIVDEKDIRVANYLLHLKK